MAGTNTGVKTDTTLLSFSIYTMVRDYTLPTCRCLSFSFAIWTLSRIDPCTVDRARWLEMGRSELKPWLSRKGRHDAKQ